MTKRSGCASNAPRGVETRRPCEAEGARALDTASKWVLQLADLIALGGPSIVRRAWLVLSIGIALGCSAGSNNGGADVWWGTDVPEPGATSLVVFGVVGVLARRGRRSPDALGLLRTRE